MNTRRDFLKTFLGVALVAPAIAACAKVLPEPVVLPAAVDGETMFASMGYRTGSSEWKQTGVVVYTNGKIELIPGDTASRRERVHRRGDGELVTVDACGAVTRWMRYQK